MYKFIVYSNEVKVYESYPIFLSYEQAEEIAGFYLDRKNISKPRVEIIKI